MSVGICRSNLLITNSGHVTNYLNVMYYRDLFLLSCLIFLLLQSITMQNILDNLWGSGMFTVNCWSWVHWHEKELLWKNPGKTNQPLIIKMLNWPTKGMKDRQAIVVLWDPVFAEVTGVQQTKETGPNLSFEYTVDLSWHRLYSLSHYV